MITDMVDVGQAEILHAIAEGTTRRQSRHETCRAGRLEFMPNEPSAARAAATARRCQPVGRATIPRRDQGESMLCQASRLSPADLEYLHELFASFGLDAAAVDLAERGDRVHRLAMPIGVARTDEFLAWLQRVGGVADQGHLLADRERLVRRLAATNIVWSNRRAVVCGEEEFVVGTVSLLLEAGMLPVLCASPADAHDLRGALEQMTPELPRQVTVLQATGFESLAATIHRSQPDVLIANQEARQFADRTGIPLVSAGTGVGKTDTGEPILHIGYRGALQMLERIEAALQTRRCC